MDREEYDDEIKDYDNREDSFEFEPQRMDKDVFKQRNDPSELMKRYRLQLMNCYVKEEEVVKQGRKSIVKRVIQRPNTKAKANSQGVEDIINYVEKLINSHTVQGNIQKIEDFRHMMRFVSNDLTIHFMTMRKTWGIDINDIDSITASAINLVDLFLTRTLENEERKGYGESFKETTNREIRPKEKLSFMQKVGSFMGWKG